MSISNTAPNANVNPSSAQQFCLKWNNYTSNLVKTFSQMATDQNFVDVTLACEGSSIKAHKVVLSACSNYFKELFLANPCKHPIVILKDMKMEDLKAIVDFMYKGEVNVFQNQLGALLKTAEILKVKGLTEVNDETEKSSDDHRIPSKSESFDGRHSSDRNGIKNDSSLNQASSRKKRRKKHKRPNEGSSIDEATESDSGSGSGDEESGDVTIAKRVKGPTGNQQNTSSEGTSNLMSSRRNFLVPSSVPQNIQAHRDLIVNSDYGQLDDSSEPWHDPERMQINNPIVEADEESDGVIDVKPIVSFDEGSVGTSINNTLSLPSENALVEYVSLSPGSTGNQSSGKICVCHLCHLTFTAYSSLRRHMQRHYADRERYECDICLKSYSRKDYLKEHKKLKHPT